MIRLTCRDRKERFLSVPRDTQSSTFFFWHCSLKNREDKTEKVPRESNSYIMSACSLPGQRRPVSPVWVGLDWAPHLSRRIGSQRSISPRVSSLPVLQEIASPAHQASPVGSRYLRHWVYLLFCSYFLPLLYRTHLQTKYFYCCYHYQMAQITKYVRKSQTRDCECWQALINRLRYLPPLGQKLKTHCW